MTPRLLIVAGHDPSGGAGVLVDERSARDHYVEPSVCVTAWTDQDAGTLRAIGARPAAEWLAEATAALERSPDVLKLGLLPGVEALRAAGLLIERARASRPAIPVVLDPVLGSSSGARFHDPEGVRVLREELLPHAPILCPNLPEAAELVGCELAELERDLRARVEVARQLLQAGCAGVVLKGGHAGGELVHDLLLEPPDRRTWIEHPRRERGGLRGSGCRHSTALAAALAWHRPLPQAAAIAARYLARTLTGGPPSKPAPSLA